MRLRLPLLAMTFIGLAVSPGQSAENRLPNYIQSNGYVAGQLLGCTIRLQRYSQLTQERAAQFGRTPPAYQLNTMLALDLDAVKADARATLITLGGPTTPIEETETAITEIADLEFEASGAGAPGYQEAWLQATGCVLLFQQFGLPALYK